jgi:hypothetical protein
MRDVAEGRIELPESGFQGCARIDETRRAIALRDIGKRHTFGGKYTAAILERLHGFRSLGTGPGTTGGAAGGGAAAPGGDDTGAGICGAVSEVAAGVDAGVAAFAGGSFRGPLMPHETIASAVSETMIVVTERRNIRLSKA